MSKTKDTHLVLTIDLRPFMRAMRQVARAVERAYEIFTPAGRLRVARRNLGGMGRDAKAWPDQWQSAICAGLLCSITPCPSDANGLGCTHSCHEEIL